MEEKNCAIDFCPRARGGYKRIYILNRFKIVSVRVRGLACVDLGRDELQRLRPVA